MSKKPTPDCSEAVSVRRYEHISMHAVYLRAPPLPICRCAIMIRGKKCLNEISVPQLPCRLPTRTCQLLPDQHLHDWKITTHIYKHWHRCEDALLKSTKLSSIRFKYCKGLRTFRNIKDKDWIWFFSFLFGNCIGEASACNPPKTCLWKRGKLPYFVR